MNKRIYVRIGLLIALIALLVSPAYAQQLSSELKLIENKSYDLSADKVMAQFTLTNDTQKTLYVLKYQTPLSGIDRDLFMVSCDGEPVPYIGPVALRLGPTAEDWLALKPGETVTGNVDLSKYYDMRKSGTYAVYYRSFQDSIHAGSRAELPVVRKEDVRKTKNFDFSLPSDPELIESNDVAFSVERACEDDGTCADQPDVTTLFEGRDANARGYCSSSQSSALSSAQSDGSAMAGSAYNYLQYNGGNTQFYDMWFGAYDSYRFSRVKDNYSRIQGACSSSISYSCGGNYCSGGVIAYVYPSYAYYIYICDGYWYMNYGDQAAVIVHEASHWSEIAGTYDYTYGYSNCQSLAAGNPNAAINNADNYRYGAQYAP